MIKKLAQDHRTRTLQNWKVTQVLNLVHRFLTINKTLNYFFPFWLFETGSCYEAQAGLDLAILLSQPLEFWECRSTPPCLAK
jgi:hypothetical protein